MHAHGLQASSLVLRASPMKPDSHVSQWKPTVEWVQFCGKLVISARLDSESHLAFSQIVTFKRVSVTVARHHTTVSLQRPFVALGTSEPAYSNPDTVSETNFSHMAPMVLLEHPMQKWFSSHLSAWRGLR